MGGACVGAGFDADHGEHGSNDQAADGVVDAVDHGGDGIGGEPGRAQTIATRRSLPIRFSQTLPSLLAN